jgi:hypothetical protein
MAAVAAASGALARVVFALQGGERSLPLLALQGFIGASLGIMAAGVVVYWDPTLRDTGWPLLIVGGAAGFAGALGNRLIDRVAQLAQRRLG